MFAKWLIIGLGVCFSAQTSSSSEAFAITKAVPAQSPQGGSALSSLSVPASIPAPQPIRSSYFGLNYWNYLSPFYPPNSAPWPPHPKFGSLKLWDSVVFWTNIEPFRGGYDFNNLDFYLSAAASNGWAVTITLGLTPTWAQGSPRATTCPGLVPAGGCGPPADLHVIAKCQDLLASDPAQTNCYYKEYVAQVADHIRNGYPQVKVTYSPWNEPNLDIYWNDQGASCTAAGDAAHRTSCDDMAQMAKDAFSIIRRFDPQSLVATPSLTDPTVLNYYLSRPLGPGQYADILDFHVYAPPNPDCSGTTVNKAYPPENIVQSINGCSNSSGHTLGYRELLTAANHMAGKPMIADEGGWGENVSAGSSPNPACPRGGTCIHPGSTQASAFLARYYILMAGLGLKTFVWYTWGGEWWGAMLDSTKTPAVDLPSVKAYSSVYYWLVGSTISPCTNSGTLWTCAVTNPSGAEMIVWSTFPSTYTLPSQFQGHVYQNLDGSMAIAKSAITIGASPILLRSW